MQFNSRLESIEDRSFLHDLISSYPNSINHFCTTVIQGQSLGYHSTDDPTIAVDYDDEFTCTDPRNFEFSDLCSRSLGFLLCQIYASASYKKYDLVAVFNTTFIFTTGDWRTATRASCKGRRVDPAKIIRPTTCSNAICYNFVQDLTDLACYILNNEGSFRKFYNDFYGVDLPSAPTNCFEEARPPIKPAHFDDSMTQPLAQKPASLDESVDRARRDDEFIKHIQCLRNPTGSACSGATPWEIRSNPHPGQAMDESQLASFGEVKLDKVTSSGIKDFHVGEQVLGEIGQELVMGTITDISNKPMYSVHFDEYGSDFTMQESSLKPVERDSSSLVIEMGAEGEQITFGSEDGLCLSKSEGGFSTSSSSKFRSLSESSKGVVTASTLSSLALSLGVQRFSKGRILAAVHSLEEYISRTTGVFAFSAKAARGVCVFAVRSLDIGGLALEVVVVRLARNYPAGSPLCPNQRTPGSDYGVSHEECLDRIVNPAVSYAVAFSRTIFNALTDRSSYPTVKAITVAIGQAFSYELGLSGQSASGSVYITVHWSPFRFEIGFSGGVSGTSHLGIPHVLGETHTFIQILAGNVREASQWSLTTSVGVNGASAGVPAHISTSVGVTLRKEISCSSPVPVQDAASKEALRFLTFGVSEALQFKRYIEENCISEEMRGMGIIFPLPRCILGITVSVSVGVGVHTPVTVDLSLSRAIYGDYFGLSFGEDGARAEFNPEGIVGKNVAHLLTSHSCGNSASSQGIAPASSSPPAAAGAPPLSRGAPPTRAKGLEEEALNILDQEADLLLYTLKRMN